jgi:2'-5' RNA ligase/GNAT superfamily N-acetyltransferase
VARSRLGVALLLPPPLVEEVNGLRRALGDPSLERVPPHITLVPPVNVRDDDLGRALAVLRGAAATIPAPLTLGIGPPASFLPDSPVLYLEVSGDLEALDALRRRALSPPLARALSWPFVPHVTVADEADPVRIDRAAAALCGYRASVGVERIHLLRETRHPGGRRWDPLADAAFGPPAVVGRGGLALELTRSQLLDPEAAAVLAAGGAGPAAEGAGPFTGADAGPVVAGGTSGPVPRIVVTARREDAAVGVAGAWLGGDGGQVAVFVDPAVRRQGVGSHLLAAVEAAVRRSGWGCTRLSAFGPPGFYLARSRFSRPADPDGPC